MIIRAAIGAAGAGRLLERALAADPSLAAGGLRVIAAGKAAPAMAAAAGRIFGRRIRSGVVVSATALNSPTSLTALVGGHPVPNEASVRAGQRALAMAESLGADETLLVLLSGGASALMAVPAGRVTLENKQRTTERLLSAGADIHALNTVRKHLSAIKGGWLAARASGVCRAFAISDVVGDDLSVIASGPTFPDASTYEDALEVLRRSGGLEAYPTAVVARLEAGAHGDLAETPKPGDARLSRASSTVIGSRRDAMDGAAAEASRRGYQVIRIDDPVVGDARTTAPSYLRAVIAHAAGVGRPACIVSTGETTVHVEGRGKGGRNQEFALALALPLASLGLTAMAASVGTDGVDGPTDAAGALVDRTTAERARAAGLASPVDFLEDNAAYPFFRAIGDLIQTGPTDTNVGDLQLFLLA